MTTELLYLNNMFLLNTHAQVIDIIKQPDISIVILDKTIFYPQGGGQPSDKGTIVSDQSLFEVQAVAKEHEKIYHKGLFHKGTFTPGQSVILEVNKDLRELHSKNHTAGHLIDYAMLNLGYAFAPTKAYHFPQGPYVEYNTTLEQSQRELLQVSLEKEVNALREKALPVAIQYIDNDYAKRAMVINGYEPILCGGTHIGHTNEMGYITIRKVKNEKGYLRVSYSL